MFIKKIKKCARVLYLYEKKHKRKKITKEKNQNWKKKNKLTLL